MIAYQDFLTRKSQLTTGGGFEPLWLPDWLFGFQQNLTDWAICRGRAAIFADCGMGKTPCQLVWAENVVRHTNRPVLILTPLAVSYQTSREAEKFGIDAAVSRDGTFSGKIVITNYEQLHRFNWQDFAGVVCDESSILKSFSGATRKRITRFTAKLPYRLLCTATAAPNDYVELGTSSECLGELSYSEMLKRYFQMLDDKGQKKEQKQQDEAERISEVDPSYFQKLAYRVAQTIGQWRLRHHAVKPFWRWVASWARACRKPSDLGYEDDGFILPELRERDYIIKASKPPAGFLFSVPAFGMGAEREERRRTLRERCQFVADSVKDDKCALVWCHMNCEGDLLEQMIPNSVQVAGCDSFEKKEAAAEWFVGKLCICQLKKTWKRGKLAACGNQSTQQSDDENIRPILLSVNGGNGKAGRQKKTGYTCRSTTPPTSHDGSDLGNNKRRSTLETGSDTQATRSIESKRRPKSSSSESIDQTRDSHTRSKSTDSQSSSTTTCLTGRAADVQSVEAWNQNERENTDSTLTIATQPGGSADCSVQAVILASENSTIAPPSSTLPPCTCGHKSGRRILISKPKIFGFGLNFQHCSHVVSFATHSYEAYYQSVRRCYRFGQTQTVTVDVVATEGELRVLGNMRRKAQKAEEMFERLVGEMSNATRVERDNSYVNKMEVPAWL